MGACSVTGCAKPDALGVYTRQSTWRTPDGRFVYVRDVEQPALNMHFEAIAHKAVDDSSGADASNDNVYLFYHAPLQTWAIGPRKTLGDDNYARSGQTEAACPNEASHSWQFWWGGAGTSLTTAAALRVSGGRGWRVSTRYPMQVSCWASPPSPPPPPPSPPSPSPPPPPAPPPPLRLNPGPYQGRLEVYWAGKSSYSSQVSSSFSLSRLSLMRLNMMRGLPPGGTGKPPAPPNRTVAAWGSVCDDGFDLRDATVACRQLGLGRPLKYWHRTESDDDDDDLSLSERRARAAVPIWLEDLQCGGDEVSEASIPTAALHACHALTHPLGCIPALPGVCAARPDRVWLQRLGQDRLRTQRGRLPTLLYPQVPAATAATAAATAATRVHFARADLRRPRGRGGRLLGPSCAWAVRDSRRVPVPAAHGGRP